ncbi:zinc ribbon domain-containing protein [bacterium]|nr:zinc ribbon domain-containing protein [bacterium]
MPIYEYECQTCGANFELIQSMSAPNPKQCEKCGQGPVQRLISRSGFVLKGGGFYSNEYPSSSRKAGLQAESKGSSDSKATATGK